MSAGLFQFAMLSVDSRQRMLTPLVELAEQSLRVHDDQATPTRAVPAIVIEVP